LHIRLDIYEQNVSTNKRVDYMNDYKICLYIITCLLTSEFSYFNKISKTRSGSRTLN